MKKTLGIFFSLIILININSLAKEKVTIAIEDNDFAPWTFGKKSKFKGQGALVELLKSFEKDLNITKMQIQKTSASGKIQYLEAHVFRNAKLLLVFRIHNFQNSKYFFQKS